MRWLSRAAGLVAVLLSGLALGAAAEPPAWQIPEEDFRLFLAFQAKTIEAALQGQPDQKALLKAEVNAVILAALAHQDLRGPEAAGRATVRDAAVRLSKLVKSARLAEARELVGQLTTLKADPAARKEQVPVVPNGMGFDELSLPLTHTRAGGLNIENHMDKLGASKKRDVPQAELNDMLKIMAYHSAVSAQLYLEQPPKRNPGPWINQGFPGSSRCRSPARRGRPGQVG